MGMDGLEVVFGSSWVVAVESLSMLPAPAQQKRCKLALRTCYGARRAGRVVCFFLPAAHSTPFLVPPTTRMPTTRSSTPVRGTQWCAQCRVSENKRFVTDLYTYHLEQA